MIGSMGRIRYPIVHQSEMGMIFPILREMVQNLLFHPLRPQVRTRTIRLAKHMPNKRRSKITQGEMSPAYLAEYVMHLGDLSYEMEMQRYESLLSSSGRLLTCCSILSVALLTFLPVVADVSLVPESFVAVSYAVVFLFVIASFSFGLVAQYRFKYQEVQSPRSLARLVIKEQKLYETELIVAEHYCDVLEEPYKSIRKRNEKLSSLLKKSTWCLGIAVGFSSLFVVIAGFAAVFWAA